MWWLVYVYYEVMTTIKVVNASLTSHSYLVCVVRTLKIYPLSKFQSYDTVLVTIVATLYIRSLEFLSFFLQWFWSLGVLSLQFMPWAGLFLSLFIGFLVCFFLLGKYFGFSELHTEKEPNGEIITCSLKDISNLENT